MTKVKDFVQDQHNFNKGTEEGQKFMEKSLKELGAGRSILVDKNGNIIAGNKTQKAAISAGIKDAIVVETTGDKLVVVKRTDVDIDSKEGRELALADNKATEVNLAWDDVELQSVADDFGIDLPVWGFELPEVENPLEEPKDDAEAKEDDFDEEKEQIEQRVTAGDVWQLGEHRLYCGDSTMAESYDRLMQGEKAVLCFTDPPYGMKKEKDGVMNDNLNFSDLLDFNKKWIPQTFANLTDNGSWYCWGIDEPLMDIYYCLLKPMMKEKQIAFRNLITWDKGNGQGQLSEEFRMYPIADEKCLFVMKGWESASTFTINADNYNDVMDEIRLYLDGERKRMGWGHKQINKMLGLATTGGGMSPHWFCRSQFALMTEENYNKLRECSNNTAFLRDYKELTSKYDDLKKEYDDLKKEYDDLKKEFYESRAYFDNTHDNMNNVWHFDRTSKEERALTGGHATPKPLALCGRGIKTSSRQGDLVLDVFGGSGSTLIACEQLGRRCRMMELDPHYCDVILTRWEKLTGKKAVRQESPTD